MRTPRSNFTPVQLQGLAWSEARAGARSPFSCGDPIRILIDVVAALDCLSVLAGAAAAFFIRYGAETLRLDLCSTTFLAMILLFNVTRAMTRRHPRLDPTNFAPFEQVSKAWTFVFVVLVVLAYVTRTSAEFSRAWAAGWYVSSLLGFALVRLIVARIAAGWRERGRLARIVAIVDLAGTGDLLARELKSSRALDTRLAGVFFPIATLGRQNGIADLVALSRLYRIDEVLVMIAGDGHGDLTSVLSKLAIVPTTVRVCPSIPQIASSSIEASVFLDRIMLTIQRRPLSGMGAWAKRVEDLVLSFILLIVTAPVLLAIALVIRLESPGPVLFRQRRLGFNNNEFVVYKFRTMLWAGGVPDSVVPQAKRNDPRITRFGRILRRTSLDELPQLFNVLRGDMSLVGPRPHAIAHNDKYAALIDGYLGRHRVQPGITGWAQVNGFRGETEALEKMEGRVKRDLAYIENWSILLDLRIIAKTALLGLFDRNAY